MPLFIADEERIRRDCKYNLESVASNRAISLGGYLWAISSIDHEQIQVRCLEETHVIEIRPPITDNLSWAMVAKGTAPACLFRPKQKCRYKCN